jgi:hypothetical protein
LVRVSAGTEEYRVDAGLIRARGLGLASDHAAGVLLERVREILWDRPGRSRITELADGLATTDFEAAVLRSILETPPSLDLWRVGEAIAEAYVTDVENCVFPWPGGRDLKVSQASHPGADLVGFHRDETAITLAFGEVKTSEQEEWPPSVVTGRSGLSAQVESLRDSAEQRRMLIFYLALHAVDSAWQNDFREAVRAYIGAKARRFVVFGILVRGVVPQDGDISRRASELSASCEEPTSIVLLALYLPVGALQRLVVELGAGDRGSDS